MNKSGVAPEVLNLPTAGGAVSSIGSTFATNLNTGTGSYAVPLDLPKGYRGQAPQLSLSYSSGMGQGELGMGWSLPNMVIERDARRGFPTFTENDTFLLNGKDLLQIREGIYRPQVDTAFHRIKKLSKGWELTDRHGTRYLIGTSANSQECRPGHKGENAAASWLLASVIDTTGNTIKYSYTGERQRRYLLYIEYAVYRFEIRYEDRPDVLVTRIKGFRQATDLRANRFTLHNTTLTPTLLRSYDLNYTESPYAKHSLLSEVILTGYDYTVAADGFDERREQAPPLKFDYTPFEPASTRIETFRSRSTGPKSMANSTFELIDLDGFGLPGILEANGVSHRYWPNLRTDAS